MNNNTKIARINQTIKETQVSLEKAIKKYNDSLAYLEMEIAENKELGNPESANAHAYEYVKERQDMVNYYKNHIERLENMKAELI